MLVGVRAPKNAKPGRRAIRIPITVTNLLVTPGRGLQLVHELDVTFIEPSSD